MKKTYLKPEVDIIEFGSFSNGVWTDSAADGSFDLDDDYLDNSNN